MTRRPDSRICTSLSSWGWTNHAFVHVKRKQDKRMMVSDNRCAGSRGQEVRADGRKIYRDALL